MDMYLLSPGGFKILSAYNHPRTYGLKESQAPDLCRFMPAYAGL